MVPANHNRMSLYQDAKASLKSLIKQTSQVFLGFMIMLLVTGGNPPGFVIGLSFCLGVGFVAWSEKNRLEEMTSSLDNDCESETPVATVDHSEDNKYLYTAQDYQRGKRHVFVEKHNKQTKINKKSGHIPLSGLIGLGLMTSLVATTMILRANVWVKYMLTAPSARSRTAAKLGITRYMNLINTYRDIASVDACGDNTLVTTGTCTDGATDSWHNPAAVVDPGDVSLIAAQASGQWRDIDPNDPEQGQYRLIGYTYDADTQTGTLTVEGRGRVREGTRTVTTRLQVGFPVLSSSDLSGQRIGPIESWVNLTR